MLLLFFPCFHLLHLQTSYFNDFDILLEMARGSFGSSRPQQESQTSSVVGGLRLWLLLMLSAMLGEVFSWRKFGARPEIQQANQRNTSHMCELVSTLYLIIAGPPTTLPQLARANRSQTSSVPDRCPRQDCDCIYCCSCTCLLGTRRYGSIAPVSA